jgi:amidase
VRPVTDGVLAGERVHAFGADVLGDLDATAVAGLIARRELSAIEVVQAAIARAERVEPLLCAIQTTDYERALDAAAVPGTGPFAGVPTFVKDNTDVAGLPSTQGSEAFVRPAAARSDAPMTTLLRGLGLVNLGKSRMPEFGLGAASEYMTQPPVRNPWNTRHSPGASSGGAAALVAAGVVPIAHANDGGGSTRIPAACCGLVGLKPTRGRLAPGPTERLLPVDVVGEGVLTRSVRDTARAFAGFERQYRAPNLPPIGVVDGPSRRRLRIGVVYESVNGAKTDDDTRRAVADTADLLADLGHRVEPIEVPFDRQFETDFTVYWGAIATVLSLLGGQIYRAKIDRSRLDGLTLGLARFWRRHVLQTPAALWRLRRSRDVYAELATTVDAVISPVLCHAPPEIGYLAPTLPFDVLFERLRQYAAFTPLQNAAGAPGLSLPLGVSTDGLPIGVHFSGAHGDERTLLEIAFEIEAARPFRRIQD